MSDELTDEDGVDGLDELADDSAAGCAATPRMIVMIKQTQKQPQEGKNRAIASESSSPYTAKTIVQQQTRMRTMRENMNQPI